jgi:hypothetical protein
MRLISAAVVVTPSRILSSAAVDVTPSRMFNSAAVLVTPSRIFNSGKDAKTMEFNILKQHGRP